MMEFSHLLIEAKSKYSQHLKPYSKTHEILESVDGFSQISLNYNNFPPIRIRTRPQIFLLKKKVSAKPKEKQYRHVVVVEDGSCEEADAEECSVSKTPSTVEASSVASEPLCSANENDVCSSVDADVQPASEAKTLADDVYS